MASRVPTRRILHGRLSAPGILGYGIEIALAAASGALVLAALSPSAADAGLFGGKKRPAEDYRPALPLPPAAAPVVANGAIFQAASGYASYHEGWRARRVGDPLTIVLVERTAASKTASSKLDSQGGLSIAPPAVGPLALFDRAEATASGNRNFNGGGSADQANSLVGEVSVTVAEVFPNGTMLVQGQKRLTLNRGDEWVRIKGLVRMADVDLNNRVPSTRVADAQISYVGKGDVARASRQGWLSRFFSVVSPF